jgi:cytochrome c-type biogenesis protein CcmH/NrfG
MRTAVAALLLAAGISGAVHAQVPADKRPTDSLLDALKTAPDSSTAAALENRLERIWLHAGSPAVTLLVGQGVRLMNAGEAENAVQSFSDAITLQPDMAEAWRQRAIARYHVGDVNGAITDLEETVRLEPRNFAAFRTLADIATARQDWKGAYAAWQKLLELDPKTPGGEDRLRDLKRRALGEET